MRSSQFELINFDQEGDRIFPIGDCQNGYVAEFAGYSQDENIALFARRGVNPRGRNRRRSNPRTAARTNKKVVPKTQLSNKRVGNQTVKTPTGQVRSHIRKTKKGGLTLVKSGMRRVKGAGGAITRGGKAAGSAIAKGGKTVGRVIANNPKTAAAAAAAALALGVGAKVFGGRKKRREAQTA